MQACCRCKSAAGFWVMASNARVVRRPWCLSCITEFLNKDEVTMTRIEAVPGARRAFAWATTPSARVRYRLRTENAHRHHTYELFGDRVARAGSPARRRWLVGADFGRRGYWSKRAPVP